jgi:hypothetical protein
MSQGFALDKGLMSYAQQNLQPQQDVTDTHADTENQT